MLMVSVLPWLTWFYSRLLTQLIPHYTAHPCQPLPAFPCKILKKCSAIDRHNWKRKRKLFWSLWLWDSEELWKVEVKLVLSCPCVRTSFPTDLGGEMRNCLHALLRIKREGKWQDFMLKLMLLIWCCVKYYHETIIIEGMFHFFIMSILRDTQKVFFYSPLAVVLFGFPLRLYCKRECNLLWGPWVIWWSNLGLISAVS